MSKKITKTIGLIVFAVFFGINYKISDANALTEMTCVYDYAYDKYFQSWGEVKTSITVNIAPDHTVSYSAGAGSLGSLHNWGSANVGGFKGKEYYEETGHCPPNLIIADYMKPFKDEIYFFDSENYEEPEDDDFPRKGAFGGFSPGLTYTGDLQSEIPGEDKIEKTEEDEKALKGINCTCENTGLAGSFYTYENGQKITGSYQYAVKYSFTLGKNAPSGKLYIQGKLEKSSIGVKNWSKAVGDSWYTLNQHLNECPYAMIVSKTGVIGTIRVYMTDEAEFDAIDDYAGKDGIDTETMHYYAFCKDTTLQSEQLEKAANARKQEDLNSYKKSIQAAKVNNGVGVLSSSFDTYNCGNNYMSGIPVRIPRLVKFAYNFIHILVPIVIIILGSIDLIKSIIGQKEDEISKYRSTFFKRLLSAALIFFVLAIVKLVIGIAGNNTDGVIDCIDCFIKNNGSCVLE